MVAHGLVDSDLQGMGIAKSGIRNKKFVERAEYAGLVVNAETKETHIGPKLGKWLTETFIPNADVFTLAGETFHTTAQAVKKSYNMISLINHFHGDDAYSYSFSGQLGSLDHALVNRQLLPAVVAVDDWHINAAETPLLEYSTENTGDLAKSDNAYSSSDHDPVIVDFRFNATPLIPLVPATSVIPATPLVPAISVIPATPLEPADHVHPVVSWFSDVLQEVKRGVERVVSFFSRIFGFN